MNNRVIRLAIWGLAVLSASCAARKMSAPGRLEVEVRNSAYTRLLLKRLRPDGELIPLDTVELANGKGAYAYDFKRPEVIFLSDGSTDIPVFLENTAIKVRIDSAFRYASVEGGVQNRLYRQYAEAIDSLKNLQKTYFVRSRHEPSQNRWTQRLFAVEDSMRLFRLSFLQAHPGEASVLIMIQRMASPEPPVKTLFDIYSTYPENIRKTPAGKYLTRLLNERSAGATGMRMQNFTAPGPDGKLLSFYGAAGKVTLVHFWASECKPCRHQNRQLARLYERFHERGLNIISVSLDRDREKWMNAVRSDGLKWYNVSHLAGWNEPVAKQFFITHIPQIFVVDKQGILRAKNPEPDRLEEIIAKLLAE